jgi:phage-related tail fiber protein
MSQTYYAILTAVGEAKLANATALGTPLQISRMAVGDGNGNLPTPNRSQTALVNERYRADLNSLTTDPLNSSQIIAELVIPETEGGYWLREIGLYDAAGALIAVSNCPPSYKPELAEGSGRTQVLRMVLIVSSTTAVQLKIDPSVVLATRAYADAIMVQHLDAADPHKQYQLRGAFTNLNANTLLTVGHEGVIVLDATAGDRTLTLPVNDAVFGVRDLLLRRADNTGNRAKVQASGTDKIKFHTHLNGAGYGFLYLMGAGDWWHLRSDGEGGWWPVARRDDSPLGRLSFETSTAIQPGGYGLPHGVLFVRADWPWIWDHAQASGMLVDDANRANFMGCWTRGDGATTTRSPDVRAEFLRASDEGRGVDIGRVSGSRQDDAFKSHVHSLGSGFNNLQTSATPNSNDVGRTDNQTSSAYTTAAAGGTETRPRNIAYPGRIKLI